MQKSTFNMSAERRAFLRPRTNLRRVGERFTKGLALIMKFPYQQGLRCSKPHTSPKTKKCLCQALIMRASLQTRQKSIGTLSTMIARSLGHGRKKKREFSLFLRENTINCHQNVNNEGKGVKQSLDFHFVFCDFDHTAFVFQITFPTRVLKCIYLLVSRIAFTPIILQSFL